MSNESLLEHALPEGRKRLIENHENLKKVASYCEQNYLGAHNKAAALNETKKYTTHSLASVAYQVNTLASDMLMLLKEQEDELLRLTSSIDNLGERVDIHCEKVSRREVGALTFRRNVSRQPTIKTPTIPERAVKYIRKAINYNEFDDVGHGLKTGQPASLRQTKNASIRNSVGSAGSTGTLTRPPQLDQRPQYGTIRAVAAPTVPLSVNQPDSTSRQRTASSNSVSSTNSGKYGQGSIRVPGSTKSSNLNQSFDRPVPVGDYSSQFSDQAYDLPPPPDELKFNIDTISQSNSSITNGDELPPPPSSILLETPGTDLPPPAFQDEILKTLEFQARPGWTARTPDDPNWAPPEYQQKVNALYDYEADREDELTFNEGATIYVIAKNADNWWEGILNGNVGLFPGNYVQ